MKTKPSYEELEQENIKLRQRVKELEAEVSDLKKELDEVKVLLNELLGQDSRNSHKPPSKDRKRYPRTKLTITGEAKKKDREAKTLEYSDTPDFLEVVKLERDRCNCGQELKVFCSTWERIQVYDLPEIALQVWEYQRERKRCTCGCLHEAVLPAGINRGVQYGSRVKGLLNYLHQYQEIPLGRCAEFMKDCFGQSISEHSIVSAGRKLYGLLEDAEQRILEILAEAAVVHSDETGLFVEQKNYNVHVRSNEHLTYYHVNKSQGINAHKAIGLLESYDGYMVHDCYKSYFKHEGKHVLCHSHIIRELLSVWEETDQQWAFDLAHHLRDTNIERQKQDLSSQQQIRHMQRYRNLVLQGTVLNPKKSRPPDNKNRGRVKQSKAYNLLQRLFNFADAATLFIRDPVVPFSNNQAERDLRMVKLKEKISGGFRTFLGAQIFCRVRGYISTLRKNGINVLDALTKAFQHNVLLPEFIHPM